MERLTRMGQDNPLHTPKANGYRSIWVVSPCFNRPNDARNLCQALARLLLPVMCKPYLVLVDNASQPALADSVGDTPLPEPWTCHHVMLPCNAGGSGGYNAGLGYVLERARDEDAVWLLDSDAVPEPEALIALLDAHGAPGVVAVGSLLQDPQTGEFYELGGRVIPSTGEYASAWKPVPGLAPPSAIEAQYLAACSLLTSVRAIRLAGLMPDTFLNGDDVAWGYRLARATGGRLVATPSSVVVHPRWDRMRTVARYFAARNAMSALPTAGVGVYRRVLREAARAATLHATGLHALAELHMVGLRHAARGRVMGPLPAEIDPGHPDRPGLSREDAQASVVGRGRVVSARARRADWFAPAGSIALDQQGGWTISTSRSLRLCRALWSLVQGLFLAFLLQKRRGALAHAPPAPMPEVVRGKDQGLSIVVVAYNRKDALLRTLVRLHAHEPTASAQIIVVDNASNDGTVQALRERYPGVQSIALEANTGVAAFNTGVRAATGRTVLVLDDDACPDTKALSLALALLDDRPEVAAVALHPRHPDGGRSEWPFARLIADATDAWPVMGCGNLVRKDAWDRVGGYCEGYFLYRNDTDLALSLQGVGGVWFDPSWVVWHDSPAAARKSVRWCHLATRNWIWMARRHARGLQRLMACLGVLQALRLAGPRPRALAGVFQGTLEGLTRAAPPVGVRAPGAWKALMALRLGRPPRSVPRYVGPCMSTSKATTGQPTSPQNSSVPAPTTWSI